MRIVACLLILVVVAPSSFAREFLENDAEIQLVYSHFDAKTVVVGKALVKLRRTDDHFACQYKVGRKVFKCTAKTWSPEMTLIEFQPADYLQVLTSSLAPTLPPPVADRVRDLLTRKLPAPQWLAGVRYQYRSRREVELFDDITPDDLRVIVHVN